MKKKLGWFYQRKSYFESFDSKMINENALELLNFIQKLKPSSAKGIYVKSVSLSSTMSSSIKIDSSVLID